MNSIRDFKDLMIWKLGIGIVKEVYRITCSFPKSEQFGLTNQMRRCSVSIPSNIAEGHIKKQTKEYCRLLGIAVGSYAELETQIIIAKELNWLPERDFELLVDIVRQEIRQINTLRKRLTESRTLNPEPHKRTEVFHGTKRHRRHFRLPNPHGEFWWDTEEYECL